MRRFKRRRVARPRWFTPNAWNEALGEEVAQSNATAVTHATNVLRGNAPFPGVTNASGLVAGQTLAELQRLTLLRIVGRVGFYARNGAEYNEAAVAAYVVHFGFIVLECSESGVPKDPLPNPRVRDDQDERWIWRDRYIHGPITRTQLDDQPYDLTTGPFYGYVDITQRRRMRNEEDLFLLWNARYVGISGTPSDQREYYIQTFHNLRCLGRFSR